MNAIRREATIAGKSITTYWPKGNKRYSHQDISQYLKRFKLCDALRYIGEVSYNLFKTPEGVLIRKGVPVFDGVLAYISMQLVENSNDYRSSIMTENDLLTAIDMYFGLPEPLLLSNENPLGCMVRFGASQHDYNRESRHTLPRTLVIYRDLWNSIEQARDLDVDDAIHTLTGLTLYEILVLSFSFAGQAKKGFFRLYEDTSFTEKYPDVIKACFEIKKQQRFVNWISCDYTEFRTLSRKDIPPSDDYAKFRFNPLHIKPALIPDRNPKPTFSQVYIAPIPLLINYRVTRGLYFVLSDYFRSLTGNTAFRNAFGLVFQEYVGLLLKKTFGEQNVIPEWTYGSKKRSRNTPDWLVFKDKKGVLIEVKQSGLFLEAKKWGNLTTIQNDLKRTIGSGVQQTWQFKVDIESGLCSMPTGIDDVEIVERIVVLYDCSYHLNSFMRDEIREIYPDIPNDYHWHTIAIEELEYYLGIVGENFIEDLSTKRADKDGDAMDFRDYYYMKYADKVGNPCNPYLDGVFNDFFSSLGL